MKKIVLLLCIVALFGFTPAEGFASSLNEGDSGDNSIDWITAADTVDLSGMNLYWQLDNLQFAADADAKLSLYIQAEKDENRVFLLDDGQDWALLMETSSGTYPLFPRQYVQLGRVACAAFNDYDNSGATSHVLVTVQQTAGYLIYDCVYDSEKEAFKIMPVYEARGINYIGGTP